MKEREGLRKRRAIDSVISAVILSGVVLVIGCSIWFFSQSAMTITAEDYAESVIENTNIISERFIVEHVAYINPNLKVWIFNYGKVDIEVKIQVGSVTYPPDPEPPDPKVWIKITAGGFTPVEPFSYTANPGDELVIIAYTRRGNNAYYRFIVP